MLTKDCGDSGMGSPLFCICFRGFYWSVCTLGGIFILLGTIVSPILLFFEDFECDCTWISKILLLKYNFCAFFVPEDSDLIVQGTIAPKIVLAWCLFSGKMYLG